MGFYGNITNTSNTTFNFDRIYPNRLAMDANVNNDGIFIGRYVLVEYQRDAAYPVVYTQMVEGKLQFYSSPNCEDLSRIKFLSGNREETSDKDNNGYFDGVYENEIVQTQQIGNDKTTVNFYKCIGQEGNYAKFTEVTPEEKSDYITNFGIDELHYSNEKGFKGYDSTVWVKTSITTSNNKLISKYVNIADLNSVVPTFDIAADAPTMTPITPHFDADSTNVYYKLHAQPQWGFRVAQADGTNSKSNVTTQWKTAEYDPTTDIKSIKYGSGVNRNGITEWSNTPTDINAAIYYNAAGFKKQLVGTSERQGDIKKHDDAIQDVIKIMPTGKSGATYEAHDGTKNKIAQEDIQELTIQLPSIGNMMSDAWDIIHGPNRDNARTDENSSLQGRLDSFKFMGKNQIPVKRDIDGTLVGTNINGNNSRTVTDITQESLHVDDWGQDDAWIKVQINTDGLLDEEGREIGNNGILIHHTFNKAPTSKTQTTSNKNNNEGNGINKGQTHDLKLYTPIVDAAGHVVGENTETVTLPYGFKTVKITEQSTKTTNPDTNTAEVIADSTQDTLRFSSSNKWIRMSGENKDDLGYDVFNIGHEVHEINEKKSDLGDVINNIKTSHTNLNSDDKGNETEKNLTIYDWSYDEAGHIKEKREHTYTLPYGFKTINVGNNTTESAAPAQTGVIGETADNTQDSLTFEATNKWIKMAAAGDNVIKFGHEASELSGGLHNLNSQTPKFGQSFNIQTFTTDQAGHLIGKGTETVTIPHSTIIDESSKNVMIDVTLDETEGKFTIHRENLGSLTLNDYTVISGTRPNQIGAGDSLQTALGKIETTIENLEYPDVNNETQFVSKVTQKDGQIEVTRANAGTLTLAGYLQGSETGDINSGDTINSAFAKLQNQITYEENRLNTILTGKEDITEAIDTFTELQDYIDKHGTEAANIVKAIENETARAEGEEEKLANALTKETGRATAAEQGLQNQINALGSAAQKNVEYFATSTQGTTADATAATIATYGDIVTHNHTEYATAAQGGKADTAIQADSVFDYGTEQKTIQDLMAIVSAQAEIILDLTNRIEALEDTTTE